MHQRLDLGMDQCIDVELEGDHMKYALFNSPCRSQNRDTESDGDPNTATDVRGYVEKSDISGLNVVESYSRQSGIGVDRHRCSHLPDLTS